jgi:hypothetical protein
MLSGFSKYDRSQEINWWPNLYNIYGSLIQEILVHLSGRQVGGIYQKKDRKRLGFQPALRDRSP